MNKDNNRLIADFMGYPKSGKGTHYYYAMVHAYDNDNMHYHDKWDWLMPVVEKIESIKSDGLNWDYCVTTERDYCVISHKGENPIAECQSDTKLSATYTACTQFIKYFNERKDGKE